MPKYQLAIAALVLLGLTMATVEQTFIPTDPAPGSTGPASSVCTFGLVLIVMAIVRPLFRRAGASAA